MKCTDNQIRIIHNKTANISKTKRKTTDAVVSWFAIALAELEKIQEELSLYIKVYIATYKKCTCNLRNYRVYKIY